MNKKARLIMAIASGFSALKRNFGFAPLFAFAMGVCLSPIAPRAASTVDFTTLEGKLLFGYQAWFGCPGSWGGGWSHWGNPPSGVQVDMYPDLTEFNKADLCAIPGYGPGGGPAYFFSAHNPNVVDMHFKWMVDYGLDGVLIQRFLSDIPGLKSQGDVTIKNIIASSAKYGRAIVVEYDVTGSNFNTWATDLENDWKYLVDQLHITSAPNYLNHKGRPLVSVWGVGLNESRNPPTTPGECQTMLDWFHTTGPAQYHASVMGGVPAGFRTLSRDARPDPGWLNVYKNMDAVQPWNVGRYSTVAQVKTSYTSTIAADAAWLKTAGVTYMPVLYPGYSFYNANNAKPKNEQPRMGGDFIWQMAVACKAANVGAMKIAMFDEVNEGTAMFKVVSKRSEAPPNGWWLALDGDGFALPSDWYLRLAGKMTNILHGTEPPSATIPIKATDPWVVATVPRIAPEPAFGLQWSRGPEGIRFAVKGSAKEVVIQDIKGKVVRVLPVVDGKSTWDVQSGPNGRVPAGVYLAGPEAGSSAAELAKRSVIAVP